MIIPSGVFTKYAEACDLMLTSSVFGRTCTLVYTEKVVAGTATNDLYQRRVMNSTGGNRGTEVTTTSETSESVTLRVYHDKKSFAKIGSFNVPDGGCMTISALSTRAKLEKTAYLLIHTDTSHPDWRFQKISQPILWGLDRNYVVCYWERT